ncbi:adenylosuccinase ade13 [Marasmius crinis-equi]|uniref:Adenylosuccinase ade13 n=1 Tax=Marasmius crinis-equi TaxID=585013 RepID=A0ABR3FUN2_9AGAR
MNAVYPAQNHPPYPSANGIIANGHVSASPVRQSQQLPPRPPDTTVPQLVVHAFWKQRLAPLPGFCSAPDLFRAPAPEPPLLTPPTPRSVSDKSLPDDEHEFGELDIHVRFVLYPLRTRIITSHFKAESYIPQYLRDIQKAPHRFSPLPPVPVYPPSSYFDDFPLSPIIKTKYTVLLSDCTTLSKPPLPENISLSPISDDYQGHWLALHAWELCKNADDRKKIVLWKTSITVSNWEQAEFSIFVPGIRENHPRLELGDIVHLKEVLVDWNAGTGEAFEGRVVMLRKREGHLYFHCPSLKEYVEYALRMKGNPPALLPKDSQKISQSFNVSFLANAGPATAMEIAIRTLGGALRSTKIRSLLHRWILPEASDLESDPPVPSIPPHMTQEHWVDGGLNLEQRVLAALSIARYQSSLPFLISGPPGTGKTRTIVETVHQILRSQPRAHILLCAPSNPATDTLAQRLRTTLAPRDMLRLNDPNRTFAEIPDAIRPFCYIPKDDGKFALPPWKALMKYKVVVTSCLDAEMLVSARCTNVVLGALEDDVMEALRPDDRRPVTPHWTHLLIDEAAQGSEPELLIPISVVYTRSKEEESATPHSPSPDYHPLSTAPQLVLCGDPNQLGPIISSDTARKNELDVSLLERLFERPVYAEHPEARSKAPRPAALQWQNGGLPGFKPFVNLTKNYRSHPAILMPPSAMFYNDSLEPYATNGLISWAGLPNPSFPLKFIGSYTKEDSINEKATWFNPGEIERIVEVVSDLMAEANKSSPPLQAQDIGVMAPWREQVWRLRVSLRKQGFAGVDVGSVEDFQGREKRVIIISCVRSTPKYLAEDRAKGIGLVFEKKRMNVAITRAKELLVVVGNGGLLSRDPYWKGFLQFAIRNNLYVGPELKVEMDGAWISKLESELVLAQEENGFVNGDADEDRRAMMIAGNLAREVLREER